jgi:DNA-binding NtrC family response regulator
MSLTNTFFACGAVFLFITRETEAMAFLNRLERRQAEAIAQIGYCNPFLPERLHWERQALGARFQAGAGVMNLPSTTVEEERVFGNFLLISNRAQELADAMRDRVLSGLCTQEDDQRLYRETVLFALYGKYFSLVNLSPDQRKSDKSRQYEQDWQPFLKDYQWYLHIDGVDLPGYFDPVHCFSIFRQLDRAFQQIFVCILGGSMPMARLRAAIWESIFTHDMRRYIRGVYKSMGDITTLITGPSGTGKELVAKAISLSRYQPFDPNTQKFPDAQDPQMWAVNLSALSSTLIESELFGHCKGAFTGAVADHAGWLEMCGKTGTVFLDEIGELEHSIQVKLLRVLQTRKFSRVGESTARDFQGKFVAATNRELELEIPCGRFREDLYYRLCADRIQTPTLREQLVDRPEDLLELTRAIAARLLRDVQEEVDPLAAETVAWIEQNLGTDYTWPGNIRELEQCVRNVLIRKPNRPPKRTMGCSLTEDTPITTSDSGNPFVKALLAGELTLDEITQGYAAHVYQQTGRYDTAASKLGVTWRTVRSKVRKHRQGESLPSRVELD